VRPWFLPLGVSQSARIIRSGHLNCRHQDPSSCYYYSPLLNDAIQRAFSGGGLARYLDQDHSGVASDAIFFDAFNAWVNLNAVRRRRPADAAIASSVASAPLNKLPCLLYAAARLACPDHAPPTFVATINQGVKQ
jgi:hypothetical protein